MARLGGGELLKAKATILCLLLLAAAPAVGGEGSPVFFRDPDWQTAERIRDAMELLARVSVSDRTKGREQLEEIGYWAVKPLNRALLEGKNPATRANAALALGTIGDMRSFRFLLKAAGGGDAHASVPTFSALGVGRFQRDEALATLRQVALEGRKDHRIAAILAVAKIGGPKALETLLEILKHENQSRIRATAVACLGFFRDEMLKPGKGGKSVPHELIMGAIRSNKEEEIRAGLLALALLGHRDLKDLYMKLAKVDDPEACRIAMLALGRFEDEDVTDLFLSALRNPKVPGTVKVMVAYLLKDRKTPAVLKELLLPRNDPVVKAALTLALSNFEEEEAASKLVYRLGDKSARVQAAAAIACSRLTDPDNKKRAIDAMTRVLQGAQGTVNPDVAHNMRVSRTILRTGASDDNFIYLGNQEFVEDLPKDIEERVLDFVNRNAMNVLGLSGLTDARRERENRPSDINSELRDLRNHLRLHPYFEPSDIPPPQVAITPRPEKLK